MPLASGVFLLDMSNSTHYTIEYKTDLKVPSYLIAFAVGDFKYGKLSHRTGVWAEGAILEKAKDELRDAETFLSRIELLLKSRYSWGKYDMVILPQGFPYGGMENPSLTFLPQSIIVGDRSLRYIMAHEMAHSWFGNFVTNANWNNFWLNEGFATWVERASAYFQDEDMLKVSIYVGYQNMLADIKMLGEDSDLTTLHPDLRNVKKIFI